MNISPPPFKTDFIDQLRRISHPWEVWLHDIYRKLTVTTDTADGAEPAIDAGTTGQYWRGDKSWQTLDKASVGLGNVDNTSDANKPISSATQTALNGKETTIAAGTTGQYWRGDKSWQTLDKGAVGLGNVANVDTTNASNISSGTLNDARLSSNVALKNQDNSFTATQNITGNAIATGSVQGATGKFGGASHYSSFEADGTLLFTGDATVWEDMNFDPSSSGGPAATLPDYVTINNVIHREFTSANNQICGDAEEIPHKAKLSETLYPHLHVFLKSGESAGTTGATFTIYWELRQSTGVTSGSVPLTATSAELTNNPHKFTMYDNTGIAGAAELGAQLALTLARTGGNAGDVVVTTYGIHYTVDMSGSRQIATK